MPNMQTAFGFWIFSIIPNPKINSVNGLVSQKKRLTETKLNWKYLPKK